jgi:trehalose 6-phosphate synthase/phosphatase
MVIGKGYLEIKPRNVNKGYFMSQIIKKEFVEGRAPDFIFALGDDTSDEEMFQYLNSVHNQLTSFKENIQVFPCTIGRRPSSAKFYLNEINEVLESLECLVQANNMIKESKLKKKYSYTSLKKYIPKGSFMKTNLKSESFTSLMPTHLNFNN